MDTIAAIHERRSIKEFDQNHEIPANIFHKLIDAARQTPTSYNLQHTRLIVIEDKKLREEISRAAWNQPQILSSSLLFVIAADKKAWKKQPERFYTNASKERQDFILKAIPTSFKDNPLKERDEAVRSGSLMAMTIMLAAKSLGYDSCPMGGFDIQKVTDLVKLPKDHVLVMILAIGKGIKPLSQKSSSDYLPLNELLIKNHF